RPFNQMELVNSDVAYENMLKKFQFRNTDDPKVYYNQDYRNMFLNHRSSLNSVAQYMIFEGDTARAREVLLFNLAKMPDKSIPYDYTNVETAELLFEVGEKEKALEITNILSKRSDELTEYYIREGSYSRDLQIYVAILGELQRVLYRYGEADLAKKVEESWERHFSILQGGRMR